MASVPEGVLPVDRDPRLARTIQDWQHVGMRALTVAVLVSALALPVTAIAPGALADERAGKKRHCPVRAFTMGDGFGADRGRRSHMGIDLAHRRGSPIFAVESGRIDRTKRQANKALQIVLRGRSGAKYYYGHMDRVLVRGGQRVKAGQVIGRMGDSGSPGQVHLHFEYWKSGGESDAIDPEPFIRRICRR